MFPIVPSLSARKKFSALHPLICSNYPRFLRRPTSQKKPGEWAAAASFSRKRKGKKAERKERGKTRVVVARSNRLLISPLPLLRTPQFPSSFPPLFLFSRNFPRRPPPAACTPGRSGSTPRWSCRRKRRIRTPPGAAGGRERKCMSCAGNSCEVGSGFFCFPCFRSQLARNSCCIYSCEN